MWLVMNRSQIERCSTGRNNGQWFPQVAQSSESVGKAYSVLQYCRTGAREDPWISIEKHPSKVVYGEASFDVTRWCPRGTCPRSCFADTATCPHTCSHCDDDAIMHGGANVFVHLVHRKPATSSAAAATTAAPTTPAGGQNRRLFGSSAGGSLGGFTLPPKQDSCPWDSFNERLKKSNTLCCTARPQPQNRIIRTGILGRRAAPFSPLLVSNRAPHGVTPRS